jgi:peptidoglycan/LPS O-acetylase OafA/YrhL
LHRFSVTRIFKSGTIGEMLGSHRGEGPGFGFMRLALAVTILVIHSKAFSGFRTYDAQGAALGAVESWAGPSRPIYVVLVPAFFALSGFLVTGSAFRTKFTSTFLAFRGLRIFPALFVEVTLCALVLGPVFTSLPLRDYFTNPGFFRYFGNIIGWITLYLPGVFGRATNSIDVVNGNVWTLPSEFHCYLIMAVIMATGLLYKRILLTLVVGVVTIGLSLLNGFGDFAARPFEMANYTIVYYFFVGMLFFHWKDYIPMRWWIFVGSALVSYFFLYSKHTVFVAPVFVTYCIVFLGVAAIPEFKWLRNRDYSYGIYLYGTPIIQANIALFPFLRGHGYLTFAFALVSATAFAAFSWNVIEKPTLALKRRLPRRLFPESPRQAEPVHATAPARPPLDRPAQPLTQVASRWSSP